MKKTLISREDLLNLIEEEDKRGADGVFASAADAYKFKCKVIALDTYKLKRRFNPADNDKK